MQFNMQNGR